MGGFAFAHLVARLVSASDVHGRIPYATVIVAHGEEYTWRMGIAKVVSF
jgi:hypothetical protein